MISAQQPRDDTPSPLDGPQGDQRLAPDGSRHEAIPGRADIGTDYTDNVSECTRSSAATRTWRS